MDIWDIIAKEFADELDEAEKSHLSSWLADDEKNRREYERLKQIWLTEERSLTINPKEDWQKVEQRIATPSSSQKEIIKHRPTRLLQPNVSPTQKAQVGIPRYAYLVAATIGCLLLVGVTLWLLRDSSYQPTPIVQQTKDSIQSFKLPDGSEIWLNTSSQLTYLSDFNVSARYIKLDGEAFMDIVPQADTPFIVAVGNAYVKVLGTSFQLSGSDTSEVISVTVFSGDVALGYQDGQIQLTANQKGVFLPSKGKLEKVEQADMNILAWKTNQLAFRLSPLHQVVNSLESYYGVDIELETEDLAHCVFTGIFDHASLDEAMEVLTTSLKLESMKRGNTIILSGAGCQLIEPKP